MRGKHIDIRKYLQYICNFLGDFHIEEKIRNHIYEKNCEKTLKDKLCKPKQTTKASILQIDFVGLLCSIGKEAENLQIYQMSLGISRRKQAKKREKYLVEENLI